MPLGVRSAAGPESCSAPSKRGVNAAALSSRKRSRKSPRDGAGDQPRVASAVLAAVP